MARVQGQVQALWDYEKTLTVGPDLEGIDQLDNANHLRSRRTLDGNPYGLTKGQHLIPREHLSWFARSNGQVYVLHKDFPRVKPFHSAAIGPFCADRLWTQKEELTSQPIEEKFYKEVARANKALDTRVREIELSQDAITKYWTQSQNTGHWFARECACMPARPGHTTLPSKCAITFRKRRKMRMNTKASPCTQPKEMRRERTLTL